MYSKNDSRNRAGSIEWPDHCRIRFSQVPEARLIYCAGLWQSRVFSNWEGFHHVREDIKMHSSDIKLTKIYQMVEDFKADHNIP